MTVPQAPEARFDAALTLYRTGDLVAAATMLERVVAHEPDRGEAWHLLGVIRSQAPDQEGALAALERAIALRPEDAEILGNLARLQIKQKQYEPAASLLQKALALAPRDAELWRNLSLVKRRRDDIAGAVEAARQVQELRPDDPAAAMELGHLLARAGDPRNAHAQYMKAAALQPDSAPFQVQLAESLRGLGQIAAAKTAAERAVKLDPDYASAHAVLGDVLRVLEDFKGAAAALDRALTLAPNLFLGNFYKGLLENDLCRVDSAIAHLDKALALDPDHPDLHWNRAVMNIRRGHWREGFAEYEWRFRSNLFVGGPRPPLPVRPQPAELAGKRVLLTAEQGIGDAIQFLRYAALVADAGARPILEVPTELLGLAGSTPGATELVARGSEPPPHDIALPLMSLPYVFATEVATAPAKTPYLHPDPAAAAAWAKRLKDLPRPRIGLAWQGNPLHRNDHNRSIALARLKPLIESLPAGWISLQKGAGSEQIAGAGLSDRLLDAGSGLQDFADTAALLDNLDLVVTIDSAVAHLSGALGRAVLLLLPWSPDFRWMLGRGDTPWYPTMRLLRQARRREWAEPLAELRSVLIARWPHLGKTGSETSRSTAPTRLAPPTPAPDERSESEAAKLEQELKRSPNDPKLLTRLSSIERRRGRIDAAIDLARRALAVDTVFIPALLALGHAQSDRGDTEAAVAAYEAAWLQQPDNILALTNLSTLRLRQATAAVDGAREGTAAEERSAALIEDALDLAQRARALDPNYVPAILAVGAALMRARDVDGAAEAYDRAIIFEPENVIALANLTLLRLHQSRSEDAEALGRRAVAVDPKNAQAHWHLALALMVNGKLREGWPEFAWRWATDFTAAERRRWPWPEWQGGPLEGRVLVWNEQGIGDELMFSRLLPELAKQVDLVVECDPRLIGLFGRSLPGVTLLPRSVVPPETRAWPKGIVAQIAAGDVSRYLRPDLASFAGHAGAYLKSDPKQVEAMRQRYGSDRPRIGLAWDTRSKTRGEGRRIPLADFLPLLRNEHLHFVSLQYGDHEAGIEALTRQGVAITVDPAVDQMSDLESFAAQVASLDLVITIDNSTAHMAGALGVPCWVLIPDPPEWRWMLDREDCVWWSSLRLFRQQSPRDWSVPLARMKQELASWTAGKGDAAAAAKSSVPIEIADEAAATRHYELLRDAGRFDDAARLLQALLKRHPENPGILTELSVIERKRKRPEVAVAIARRALSSNTKFQPAFLALGAALSDFDRHDEAAEEYEKALAIEPRHEVALVNLSALRLRQGRSIEAEELGRRAVEVAPQRAHSHWHLALALLTNGKYREGWSEFEWRWATGLLDAEKRDWPWPAWQGEALDGRLLVWTEQGIGDELMFASLLPELAGKMKIAVECEPRLVPLMARSLPGVKVLARRQGPVIASEWPSDIGAQSSAGDLMRYLRPDPASFAGRGGPYLQVDPKRRDAARRRYGSDRLRVGIAWYTASHNAGTSRAVPLPLLEPLLRTPGMRFVNLQYGDHKAEVAALAAQGIELFQDPTFDQMTDLEGFAAQVAALDLVITIDNSTAHMAGALGVPCWVLLPKPAEWRWLLDRSDCLWWPSLQLFRQTRSGDWSVPLSRLQEAFAAWVNEHRKKAGRFDEALQAFEADRIDDAQQRLEALLRELPDHALGWQLLGVILSRSGPPEAALEALQRAVALAPKDGQAAENLGKFLLSRKAWSEAAEQLARAQAIAGPRPDLAEKQAVAFLALRRFGEAADALAVARRLKPADAALARRHLGALRDARRFEEAADLARSWIDRVPDDLEVLGPWVEIERGLGRPEAALELAQRMIAQAPDRAASHAALAVALADLERWDEAADACLQALALEPENGSAASILCGIEIHRGHADAAERAGRAAIARAPDNAVAHWNFAHALLTNGKFREGWAEYEWRWRTGMLDKEKRAWPWPEWQGEALQGKRLLVHAEQGFGDTLQFARLLPLLKARGATLLLEAQRELIALFAGLAGVDRLIPRGDAFPAVDFQIPLMSLPHRLALTLENIPAAIPYLAADPARIAVWAERLKDRPGPRIGLCWQGGRGHDVDHWRSASLALFAPLIEAAPAASFVSLQKQEDRAEIAAAGLEGRVHSVAAELGDFADTAGLLANLDLVVTVDTAVGHLAGAMGKPVWLILAEAPDFRWMRDRADSPWYPFHRLFRQRRRGDWRAPVADIAAALPRFLAEIRGSRNGGPAGAKLKD
jgi:tetratricopeptide (TPR) repeat protein